MLSRWLVPILLGLYACADASGPQPTGPTPAVSGTDSTVVAVSDIRSLEEGPSSPVEVASKVGTESGQQKLVVAVIADLNGSYGSTTYPEPVHAALGRIVELSPDLVLIAGDMVAGQRSGLDYDAMWDGFFQTIGAPLRRANIPIAPTPGNHDGSRAARFSEERVTYTARWRGWSPPPAPLLAGSDYPVRYAFERGPALFIALDASQVGPLPASHRAWIRQTLRATNRPAKIIFGHLPLHPIACGRERETLADAALETLMVEEEVDLYLSGHHHAYYPGRRGALRLVSVGCLGGGARPLIGTTEPTQHSFVVLHIEPSGHITIDGVTGPAFRQPFNSSALPPRLGTGESTIERSDDSCQKVNEGRNRSICNELFDHH